MNFHGNTNPSLIAQCLLKYAPSKGIVLDPMAGSGTTIDLCRELGLKIKAYDIHPLRDDIEFGDAENLNLEDGCIDFIFAHWPYWKKVIYSEHPDDLSSQSLKRFYEKTKGIMQEMYRLLKKNRFFALLIGDHRHNGGLVDLSSHLSIIGSKRFKLFDKIIFLAKGQRSKRLGTESTTNKWRAKKHNYHLIDADVLLIFKKEAS